MIAELHEDGLRIEPPTNSAQLIVENGLAVFTLLGPHQYVVTMASSQ